MTTTLKIKGNPNFVQDKKDLNPPIDLNYFPNRLGINLCSVESESWTRREDGQLEEIIIKFSPNLDGDPNTLEEYEEWVI